MCEKKPSITRFTIVSPILAFFLSLSLMGQDLSGGKHILLTFENVNQGNIPEGWKVEATQQKGSLANWKVTADATAPSGEKVLALTKSSNVSRNTYNLCWTPDTQLKHGVAAVKFKINAGVENEGGGILWQVLDKNNFYGALYDAVEHRFSVYLVKDGMTKRLSSTRVVLSTEKWHSLKISLVGSQVIGYLDDKKYLETPLSGLTGQGGVGLWTKTDALTSFDNFEVILPKPIRTFE